MFQAFKSKRNILKQSIDSIREEFANQNNSLNCLTKNMDEHAFYLEQILYKINLLTELFNGLKQDCYELKDTCNLIARCITSQEGLGEQKLKIVFLIHHIAAIDAILPIIQEAKCRGHATICITIKNNFKKNNEYGGEEDIHNGLSLLGIPHLRFANISSIEGLSLLKAINPDYIFKQSPWDDDVEYGYRSQQIMFSKLCYTPYYGIQITENFSPTDTYNLHTDQNLHRKAWAIFLEAAVTGVISYRNSNICGASHRVPTGLPKYEYIQNSLLHHNTAKKQVQTDIKTILWAPHHSFDKNWLNFGTFPKTYKTILEIARTGKYAFIFRPHPLFKRNLINSDLLTEEIFNTFLDDFLSLPNTDYSLTNDPIEDFKKSDLLLSDGISFLASYQVYNKPIIWIEHQDHALLTKIGKIMTESIYIVKQDDIKYLPELLSKIIDYGNDPLEIKRQKFVKDILLGKGRPSKKILDFLETKRGFTRGMWNYVE